MKTKVVSIRLADDLREYVDAFGRERRMSRTEVMSLMIRRCKVGDVDVGAGNEGKLRGAR